MSSKIQENVKGMTLRVVCPTWEDIPDEKKTNQNEVDRCHHAVAQFRRADDVPVLYINGNPCLIHRESLAMRLLTQSCWVEEVEIEGESG